MAIDTEEHGTVKKTEGSSNVAGAGSQPSTDGNKKALKIILIIVGIVIVLGILSSIAIGFALKKGAETVIEAATGSSVKIDASGDGGNVTIKGKDGSSVSSSTGADAKLSKGFPESDVPMYKGAKIESAGDMTISGATSYTVSLSTKDKISSVVSFYETKLSGDGWKKTFSSNSSDGSMLNFTNESKEMDLSLYISTNEDKGNTEITVTLRVGSYDE